MNLYGIIIKNKKEIFTMKKLISVLLATIMLVSAFSICALATDMFESDLDGIVYLYQYPSKQDPQQLKQGTELGQYINIDDDFSVLALSCPSWSDNIGSMTLTVYKWSGDYETSKAGTPVAKQTYVDYNDNQWLLIAPASGEYFPKGEYLWTLTDPVQDVGIWKAFDENMECTYFVESFLNGQHLDGILCSAVLPTYAAASLENLPASETVTAVPQFKGSDVNNIILYTDSPKAFVKGEAMTLDVPPMVIDGRTLLPARFVAENLGASVSYEEETRTVTIEQEDRIIVLTIDSNVMSVSGEVSALDVPAQEIGGRTLVPLRAIATALGQQVNYFEDGDKGLIVVGPTAEKFSAESAAEYIANIK